METKPDVIISKKNEVYAMVSCERAIAQELSDTLTFMVPGYQFMPSYRNKIFDGKIRLLNTNTKLLYFGLIPYVVEFCESHGYTYEYDHTNADMEDEFSAKIALEFFSDLNLHAHGKPITVNEHQAVAFIHSMQKKRALLLSPTSSGKSLIIYLIFRQLLQYQGLKGLIIVPTVNLVSQLFSDFEDYSSGNGFDVDSNVHKVYQGQDKDSNKKLIISTWQSVYKQDSSYFEQFDYVMCDEVHLAQANSIRDIMEKLLNTKYRIGLTGTLSGMKCFDKDTQITTQEGTKKISEVTTNDVVLTYNEISQQTEYKKVLNTFNNGISNEMIKIYTEKSYIIVTPKHKIYTTNRGWVCAEDLCLSDELVIS